MRKSCSDNTPVKNLGRFQSRRKRRDKMENHTLTTFVIQLYIYIYIWAYSSLGTWGFIEYDGLQRYIGVYLLFFLEFDCLGDCSPAACQEAWWKQKRLGKHKVQEQHSKNWGKPEKLSEIYGSLPKTKKASRKPQKPIKPKNSQQNNQKTIENNQKNQKKQRSEQAWASLSPYLLRSCPGLLRS